MKYKIRFNGVGDWVERTVKPVAKLLHSSCLDAQGKLKPDSRCQKIKDFLNAK